MKIPFKGLVRNTPAGLAQDGELEDVCNVRYKDGAWRTIHERVAIFDGETLPYTNIFIHSNAGYKHYLGLKADGTFEYFAKDDEDSVPTLLQTADIAVLTTLTAGATFTQIGNVININNNGLKYLIWYDNAYVLIDSNFDGAQDSTTVGPVKVDLKVDADFVNAGGKDLPIFRQVSGVNTSYSSPADFNSKVDARKNEFIGLNTKVRSLLKQDGYLVDYLLACTAIELYDGTYILHSNPVLIGQACDKLQRYEGLDINGNLCNYNSNSAVFRIDPKTLSTNDEYIDCRSKYLVSEVPFQSSAIKNTTYISYVDFPASIGYLVYGKPGTSVSRALNVISYRNNLKFKINQSIPVELKPLIKSVSVFITPEISIQKEDIEVLNETYFEMGSGDSFVENMFFKPKTNAEIITELAALKNFYKVHEIPFDNITAGDWTTIDLKDKLGDSLLTLQPLPIDNFSHHTTLPEVQFVYNSKLHIANYKTELSHGWPVNYFEHIQGIGQFEPAQQPGDIDTQGWLEWAEVSIKTEIGTSKVVRFTPKLQHSFLRTYSLVPIISYPDSRAYSVSLFRQYFDTENNLAELKFPLKEATSGNFAYYIAPDLKPIAFDNFIVKTAISIPDEAQRILTYQNTLKVSEVNNPFMFPAINTYQIGNGDIIGLTTNTVALSTGQFGQFPVYVFCTDGIYGLYVGGAEINYSSSRPVSREVCNNAHSIKAIDTGVIFTTDKGVMVLVGSEVKELSEPLRGGIFDTNKLPLFKKALNHVKLTSLLPEITTETIHDYIQSAIVGYNYTEREIWFTNPDLSYSYIFSQGAWYKVKQTGSRYIDDYPKQYILEGGKLIDISSEEGTYQQCYLLTRPIKMGDVEFKQMLTAVIRGRILVENVSGTPVQKKWAGIHVYGSYDGERWVFLGGNEKNGELNDFGTRVERTDCKYFRVAFYGNINNDSYINYLELEGKQSILSTKLR